ncbi:MAG: rubredoxin [candidate division WOR-3 bacterium]|nr:rubredoxin [candidate division WOR-3 bacterium]
MEKWRCVVCGYIYNPEIGDPESGIAPGVLFEELPDSWGCPECGAEKELFEICSEDDDYGIY